MDGPPPPPPPHGAKTSWGEKLPTGNYDVFIVPPQAAGAGFIYLPSMKPNVNSFVAGFASALLLVVAFQSMAPFFRAWWNSFQGLGNFGMMLLIMAVGLGAWSFGRTQTEGVSGSNTPGGGHSRNGSGFTSGPPPHAGPQPGEGSGPPPPPPPHGSPPPNTGPQTPGGGGPKASWQQHQSTPQPETPKPNPKGAWEKAREETRRREEERKAKEAEQKRKDDLAKRLKELREKEAAARAQREKEQKEKVEKENKEREQREKELREKEAKEKAEKDKEQTAARVRETREKELRERLEREKALREKLEREAKEREANRLQEDGTRKSTYAYSSMGERTNPWPGGKPPPSQASSPAKPNPAPASAKQRPVPPAPTVRSYTGTTEEDTYSYRPYDTPKNHHRRRSGETIFTESSYAPSQSTSRTTPPPSHRGPYSTKDPDKIMIRAVYGFLNQFSKTPASQLLSGMGSVTDGLILRITTEGLFIDDDVRGVPQREWDVKAWTLKLMEVWCPSQCSASASTSSPAAAKLQKQRFRMSERGQPKTLTGDNADAYLMEMLQSCKDTCRLGVHDDNASEYTDLTGQSGENKARGLHVLRATIRDQEGKRYMFVLDETEGWKVALGLKRLKGGTQVRQLGFQGMSQLEAKNSLEMLGW